MKAPTLLTSPTFKGRTFRHVLIDNDPWFVAADVCRILFKAFDKAAGTTQWLQGLAKHEKRVAKHTDEKTNEIFVGQSMSRSLSLVSESGLYKVILRASASDNMVVRDFQDWVTCDVLPSIRKTGGYLLNEEMRTTAAVDSREEFPMPTSFSEALRKLVDEVERREMAERLIN